VKYWVFTIGRKDQRPRPDWLVEWPHHLTESWFARTKRPVGVSKGDRAVVYGSQGRGFLAVVEVESDAPEPNLHPNPHETERYPYVLRHRLLVSKRADEHLASPEDAGVNPRKIVRGPHTEISRNEYERCVAALVRAATHSALSTP
jgi:hypothetical protein